MKKRRRKPGPGRNKLNAGLAKNDTITVRINDGQQEYLEDAVALIEEMTGGKVSKSWVILTLIEMGKPTFEKKYSISSK